MASDKAKSRGIKLLVGSLILLAVFQFLARSRPENPKVWAFAGATPMAAAAEASARNGMPVLAMVTADWCAPCQDYKHQALMDAGVTTWITQNTHPVVLDATTPNDQVAALGVYGFPTLVMLRDGREVSRLEGVHSAAELLSWLRACSGPVEDWKYSHPGQALPGGATPAG